MTKLPPVVMPTSLQTSDRLRKKLGTGKYVPREREPNEALTPQIDKLSGTYVPPDMRPSRPNAEQFLSIKSKGFSC
jgi:hypothetical protein